MKTILIVEDDLAIVRGLSDNLERQGYKVIVERDGLKGYERARAEQPDLVILDVMLPTIDGFEVCSLLKRELLSAPIFLLTGLTQERSRLEGLAHGADDYIAKPFSVEELILRIGNALKQRDLMRSKTKSLEEEFLKARRIQIASVPKTSPSIKGLDVFGKSIPATHVGGDYFDYIRLDRNKLGIVIADVSGKGMPAALYVQKIQGIIRSSPPDVTSPAEILLRLQKHLTDSMDSTSFVTAAVCVIDSAQQILEVAQAGHTPGLLVRKGKVRLLKPAGVWIGKTSSDIFAQHLTPLSMGLKTKDSVVFFSDGMTEAKNGKGTEFGLSRLKKTVTTSKGNARTLVEDCLQAVKDFVGTEPQLDDITVIAAKFASISKSPKGGQS